MGNRIHVLLNVNDRSYFAIIKKEIHQMAVGAHFSEPKIAEIDIVVAEIVTNLVKHAGGGQVWVKLIGDGAMEGMEIISIDNGPGMTDVSRMVVDGVSTKNTLGNGLGAMKRLSDVFQVYSQKDWGTVILLRIFKTAVPAFRKPSEFEIRSILLPKPGETACGDGFFHIVTPNYIKLFLGDGLGHGVEAEKAVLQAGEAFRTCHMSDPVDIIRLLDTSIKKTRGAVGTVAVFDKKELKWKICGVGNIQTRCFNPMLVKNHMSYNGIIGMNVPRTLNTQEINHEKGQLLIMCSDGLKTKWDVLQYPAIWRYDPSILAAVLIKDFGRFTDDTSVAVCKIIM
jgi:anti-sigma regulatory factor (Ser/Thr protein kinase)